MENEFNHPMLRLTNRHENVTTTTACCLAMHTPRVMIKSVRRLLRKTGNRAMATMPQCRTPMKIFPSLLLLLLACVSLSQNADADTLYVDSLNGVDTSNRCIRWDRPCQTLDHAVEVAAGGDTLELLAQDYPAENILVDKPLTFIGINKSHTRVVGTGSQRHFIVNVGATELVSFRQMAFTEGNAGDEDGGPSSSMAAS